MDAQAREGAGRGSGSETALKALLACGIVSSLLYVASDVLNSALLPGYSYVNQAISELMAVGAASRPLMLGLMAVYNLLVIVFAVGVWRSAGAKRSLRIVAVTLVVYAVVGQITQTFSPMNPRGTTAAPAANDIGHIILTAVEVLSIVAFVAFGSGARGRGFRIFSLLSILVIMAGGITTGALSTQMTALASSTPWAGLTERVNIYGTMLWIAALAFVLLRAQTESVPVPARLKKVTAFVGSGHTSGATYTSARMLLDKLEAFGDVRSEIVVMNDYDLGVCRGCKVCFEHGEERCPLKDDRDVLIAKMEESDAVVWATPNYSFQVSGAMKLFLDRLGFACHRPRFHGKTSTAIVVQGFYGGGKIVKYLDFLSGALGFKAVKGSVIATLEPMTDKGLAKRDAVLAAHSRRLHEQLLRPTHPVPSLLELALFRAGRTGIRLLLPEDKADHIYYSERGWLESDYYYPTRLGVFKRAVGAFVDRATVIMQKDRAVAQ